MARADLPALHIRSVRDRPVPPEQDVPSNPAHELRSRLPHPCLEAEAVAQVGPELLAPHSLQNEIALASAAPPPKQRARRTSHLVGMPLSKSKASWPVRKIHGPACIGVGYRGPNRFGTDFTSSIPIAPLVSCIVAVAIASSALSAGEYRSRELTPEFQREHPCPSTGFATSACTGYLRKEVDAKKLDISN